jgi:hypothetical protein
LTAVTEPRQKLRTTALALAGSLLAALLSWGAAKYDDSKLDAARFVTDSVRRDGSEARTVELLGRIDARLRAMYCEGKPPGCQ